MAITDYQVLEANNAAQLGVLTADAISDEWQPYGTPFSRNLSEFSDDLLCQAFIKGDAPGSIEETQTDVAALNTQARLFWVDVAATAALLDAAGTVTVKAGEAGYVFKVRDIKLVGGGTNFGAGGDRLLDLTDGTTIYTIIANADLETAPAASLPWGNAKVPMLTGTSNTATVEEEDLVFQYSGGTTDHTTGSITFSVLVEKIEAA